MMNVANVQKYFVISRYSKLFYSINTRFLRFHIAYRILLPLQLPFISHVARYAPSLRQLLFSSYR